MLLATVLGLPGGSVVKNPPTVQEMWVRYLGWEDPLEKEMGTYSSILAWKIPWTEKLCELQSMRSQKSDMTERLIMHALPLTGRMEEENILLLKGKTILEILRTHLLKYSTQSFSFHEFGRKC